MTRSEVLLPVQMWPNLVAKWLSQLHTDLHFDLAAKIIDVVTVFATITSLFPLLALFFLRTVMVQPQFRRVAVLMENRNERRKPAGDS